MTWGNTGDMTYKCNSFVPSTLSLLLTLDCSKSGDVTLRYKYTFFLFTTYSKRKNIPLSAPK